MRIQVNLLVKRLALCAVAISLAGLALAVLFVRMATAAPDYTVWNDVGIVYTAPSGGAYYPSVLYDVNGFGGSSLLYKMWYSDGNGGVFLITSTNGVAWGTPTSVGASLGNDAHHVQVLYDPDCFEVTPCNASTTKYKVWYWDINAPGSPYTITALATAQSVDGLNWGNDEPLTQSVTAPLVTGGGSGWNRGSYGPISLFYQPGASNSGSDPWDYSYVMYYDGQDGQHEVTGLAYSADGVDWTAYSSSPVLNHGSSGAWDEDDSAYGAVMRISSTWHFWYSGGSCLYGSGCPVSEGIGYASSSEGITWTKATDNPIFHINDGVSYRSKRVYTPSIVDDGSGILKMYYTAVGTDDIKKIGMASLAPETVFVDDSWSSLSLGTQVTFTGETVSHTIGLDAFDTIQKGINAVHSAGTVKVAAGTYNENPRIGKSLTLVAVSGAISTIINGLDGEPYGIYISAKNVTVDGFTITNPEYNDASDASGIVVLPPIGSSSQIRITNNIVHDVASVTRPAVTYGTVGINVGPIDGLEIDHNVIYNIQHSDTGDWANGISLWGNGSSEQATNINIHNNIIYDVSSPYSSDAGISLQDYVDNVTIYNNSIYDTDESGVEIWNTNSTTVDAGGNWWGSDDPAVVKVAANGGTQVDYTPWLHHSTDTSTDPGFQGDFSYLDVDDDSLQIGSRGRIQEGIDLLADGSLTGGARTVNVVAGTYYESDITISKSLTLLGAGESSTLVGPAVVSTHSAAHFPAGSHQGIIVNADIVTIKLLTLNGNLNTSLSPATLNYHNGIVPQNGVTVDRLTLQNVTVKNVWWRGVNLRWGGSDLLLDHVTVQNVSGYASGETNREQNIGIVVFGPSSSEIHNSTVISAGVGIATGSTGSTSVINWHDNQVSNVDVFAYEMVGVDTGSTFTDNTATNASPGDAAGFYSYASRLTVQDSSFTGFQYGAFIEVQNAPVTDLVLSSGVTFTGPGMGVAGSVGILGKDVDYVGTPTSFTVNGAEVTGFETGVQVELSTGGTSTVIVENANIHGNTTAVKVGTNADVTVKGNMMDNNPLVFSQSSGFLTAYANNITNFTTGVNTMGGTFHGAHNWWGSNDPLATQPGGLSNDDWQHRLGSDVHTWVDGNGSATLGNARLTGGTGSTAVIVNQGNGLTNAPFDNGVTGHGDQMCSDFYDFFTVNGSGTWSVSVPVDSASACDDTYDRGSIFWIPASADYGTECSPGANPACWDLITTNVITGGRSITVTNLSVSDLGGTPFVAGDSHKHDPTAVQLVRLRASSEPRLGLLPVILLGIALGGIGASQFILRRLARHRSQAL